MLRRRKYRDPLLAALTEARREARRMAERALEQSHTNTTPVDPTDICRAMGYTVRSTASFENADPLDTAWIENGASLWPHICFNYLAPRRAVRFAIAHMLGHALRGETWCDRDDIVAEHWCNEFAACLLMPRKWFMADMKKHSSDIILSSIYDMSPDAIGIRRRTIKQK